MEKWLILADDLTGSLDTGVQFARFGVQTRILIGPEEDLFRDGAAEVFVMDTESRHIAPSEAEERVCQAVRSALRAPQAPCPWAWPALRKCACRSLRSRRPRDAADAPRQRRSPEQRRSTWA